MTAWPNGNFGMHGGAGDFFTIPDEARIIIPLVSEKGAHDPYGSLRVDDMMDIRLAPPETALAVEETRAQ